MDSQWKGPQASTQADESKEEISNGQNKEAEDVEAADKKAEGKEAEGEDAEKVADKELLN